MEFRVWAEPANNPDKLCLHIFAGMIDLAEFRWSAGLLQQLCQVE